MFCLLVLRSLWACTAISFDLDFSVSKLWSKWLYFDLLLLGMSSWLQHPKVILNAQNLVKILSVKHTIYICFTKFLLWLLETWKFGFPCSCSVGMLKQDETVACHLLFIFFFILWSHNICMHINIKHAICCNIANRLVFKTSSLKQKASPCSSLSERIISSVLLCSANDKSLARALSSTWTITEAM